MPSVSSGCPAGESWNTAVAGTVWLVSPGAPARSPAAVRLCPWVSTPRTWSRFSALVPGIRANRSRRSVAAAPKSAGWMRRRFAPASKARPTIRASSAKVMAGSWFARSVRQDQADRHVIADGEPVRLERFVHGLEWRAGPPRLRLPLGHPVGHVGPVPGIEQLGIVAVGFGHQR